MLGGVSGVASFITTDEQLQSNRGCCFLMQAMLPEGFPFHQFIYNISHANPGDFVHIKCRKTYTNPNCIAGDTKENQSPQSRNVRSKTDIFRFEENCLFCGHSAKYSERKRGCDVFPVRTLDFQKTILEACSERGDDWGKKVRARVEYAYDLPAAGAVYHQSCSTNFRTKKMCQNVISV